MTRKSNTSGGGETQPPVEPPAEPTSEPNYEEGYGRPPLQTRFKPGQSGNPAGRKKGARNLTTELREELFGPIPVVEGGRRTKMPRIRVALRKQMEKAFTGDPRAMNTVLNLALRLMPEEADAALAPGLSAEDQDLLDLLSDYARKRKERLE